MFTTAVQRTRTFEDRHCERREAQREDEEREFNRAHKMSQTVADKNSKADSTSWRFRDKQFPRSQDP